MLRPPILREEVAVGYDGVHARGACLARGAVRRLSGVTPSH
jgi:hypothetical protein